MAGSVFSAALVKRRWQDKAQNWKRALAYRSGRVALITGASSGIGEAYARALASLGYNLILVARNAERLTKLSTQISQDYGILSEVLSADLTTSEGIGKVEERILRGGGVDFLVNNAGYGFLSTFAQTPIQKILEMVNCHTMASVRLTRAALPGMIARRHGAVINVSSLSAFAPTPRSVTYSATKGYLNNFSQALHHELAGSGVRVQALCAGFTHTGFHDSPELAEFKAGLPSFLWSTPQSVVEASIINLEQDRVICIPGLVNQVAAGVARMGLVDLFQNLFITSVPTRPATAMKESTLDLLACPACQGDLELSGDLVSGILVCKNCHQEYAIIDGIPRFAPYQDLTGNNQRFAWMYDWFSLVYRPFAKVAFAFIGGGEAANRREITDRLEPRGGRVLEVSIGPGNNLPYLVGQPGVRSVYGLDLSVGQLQRCRSFTQKKSWDVDLFQGNAEALPFKDNTFESVFHVGGINFFNDKKKAITEMIRVAKPGAKIVISDETERGARGYELTLPGFKRSFEGKREVVTPPLDLIPTEMEEIKLDTNVWRGWFYCIEFRKPQSKPGILPRIKLTPKKS